MEEELQSQNQLHFPMFGTSLISFDPNSFPYVLIHEQQTVIMDGKTVIPESNGSGGSPEGTSAKKIRGKLRLPSNLENNVEEVKEILTKGCFCLSKNCLGLLDPESVYRHRTNLFRLNKVEQNMFLMGALSTCTTNCKGPTRKIFTKYTYKGKRVCKEAFLYLQCCTPQQLNIIRDHLITCGIFPINHSTKCSVKHDLFFNDSYKLLKTFLAQYMEEHIGKENVEAKKYIFLPLGTTKKSLHQAYKAYVQKYSLGKFMGYDTFRNFLAEHFPHVIFYKFGGTLSQTRLKRRRSVAVQAMPSFTVVPEVVPLQNQAILFEDQGILQIPDLLGPMMITQIFGNFDSVDSFGSDRMVISDL